MGDEEKKLEGSAQSAGEVLKQEREAQGISIDEVHELTKIPMDAIRAIEDGYTIRTLSPFYRKSFIKIYAKCLDLDASELLKEDAQKIPPARPKEKTKDSISLNVGYLFSQIFTPLRLRQAAVILIFLLGFFLLFKSITFVIGKISASFKKQPAEERVVKTPPAIKAAEERVEVVPQPQPTPVRSAPPLSKEVTQPVQKDVNITVRAVVKTWLRIKADGETVFQSTLQKGAVETWEADKNIEISGGIHKLEFEINGKLIGELGRRDRRAKSILVTKEGMTVQKDD